MGCDIHFVVERKEADSEWVGVWASDHLPRVNRPRVKQRDYDFFAELARVRGSTETSLDRRGWPKQPSRLAWLLFQRAPTDYHNVSHLTPKEFCDAYLRANPNIGPEDGVRRDYAEYDLLGVYPDDDPGTEYRVVFWFDN